MDGQNFDTQLTAIRCNNRDEDWRTRSTTTIDVHVGMMAKLRRLELGLTQEQVAEALCVTAQQIQKYERGANRIGASRLFELSLVLEVEVQYFFKGLEAVSQRFREAATAPPTSQLIDSLGDATTLRLLTLFASIPDAKLRSNLVRIVESFTDAD